MCDPVTLIAGAVAGGIVSKASGGSFGKGAALGSITGGLGVGVDRLTGGHLTDKSQNDTISLQNNVSTKTYKEATLADASVTKVGAAEKQRALLASAQSIKTSPQGLLGSANTTKKSLLGQ